MNTLTPAAPVVSIAAQKSAANFAANARAALEVQPLLNVSGVTNLQWILGRDGYLSALDESHQWLAGCSIPLRASEAVLKTLDVRGSVACFLSPCHAGELRAALNTLRPEQSIIAIVPEQIVLNQIFHCDDFSQEMLAHRLFFAAGENWTDVLRQILLDNPGLAEPQQFIKTNRLAEENLNALVSAAQSCINDISKSRAAQIAELRSRPRRSVQSPLKPGVIGGSRFRLWSGAGRTLAHLLGKSGDVQVERLDPDDPAESSSLALAALASRCDAIVSADLTRADAPNLVPMDQPWLTWITQPRIIAAQTAGPNDLLILAEPKWQELARRQGWPDERVLIGAWPMATRELPLPKEPALALLSHATSLDVPADVAVYSSHRLLWESIRHELLADPFICGVDLRAYLTARMKKLNLAAGTVNEARFVQDLVLPARRQGIALALVKAELPLSLHGTGWDRVDGLAPLHQSNLDTQEQFEQAIAFATALVHVWPTNDLHEVDYLGRPVLRSFGSMRQPFLQGAAQALRTPRPYSAPDAPAISSQLVVEALTKSLRSAR